MTQKPEHDNESSLKEALLEFKSLVDCFGIQAMLAHGTLLWAYRNGFLGPWDADVDVILKIDNPDSIDFWDVLDEAEKRGFEYEFAMGDLDSIGLSNEEAKMKRLDWREWMSIIYLWWPSDKPCCYELEERGGRVRIDVVFAADTDKLRDRWKYYFENDTPTSSLYGAKFYIPSNVEKELVRHYGERWREYYCSSLVWGVHWKKLRDGIIPPEVKQWMDKHGL